jgi:hypothetical protein
MDTDETRIGIPEVGAIDRVDSQPGRVAIRPFTRLTAIARICENPC